MIWTTTVLDIAKVKSMLTLVTTNVTKTLLHVQKTAHVLKIVQMDALVDMMKLTVLTG